MNVVRISGHRGSALHAPSWALGRLRLSSIHNSRSTIYDTHMAGRHNAFSPRSFYPSTVSEQERKEFLAQILRERKEKHDADEAERERLYTERHAARMEDFREQISRDDRFTEEEKARIIEASWEW
jgi:hypothetical protein